MSKRARKESRVNSSTSSMPGTLIETVSFPLLLEKPRAAPKRAFEDKEKRGRGRADEAELLRNLAALETKGTIGDADDMDLDLMGEDKPAAPVQKASLTTMPHPRFNAQLAVQGDVLYIFGGTFERGDREFTFAEMHAIDLGKMDGVTEIYRTELDRWQEDHAESESNSDEDDDSEDSDSGDEEGSGVALPPSEISTIPSTPPVEPPEVRNEPDNEDAESSEGIATDNRPHPRPFESLREFFVRTSNLWQDLILADARYSNESSAQSVKQLRKAAFEIAETKWWDSREEITAEEERQEEAGIGEIVSMADRGNEGGGANRRR